MRAHSLVSLEVEAGAAVVGLAGNAGLRHAAVLLDPNSKPHTTNPSPKP